MVRKIYSVETESHGYADDTFTGTIGECEDLYTQSESS